MLSLAPSVETPISEDELTLPPAVEIPPEPSFPEKFDPLPDRFFMGGILAGLAGGLYLGFQTLASHGGLRGAILGGICGAAMGPMGALLAFQQLGKTLDPVPHSWQLCSTAALALGGMALGSTDLSTAPKLLTAVGTLAFLVSGTAGFGLSLLCGYTMATEFEHQKDIQQFRLDQAARKHALERQEARERALQLRGQVKPVDFDYDEELVEVGEFTLPLQS